MMANSPDLLRTIHERMRAAAVSLRLPLRAGRWSGAAGSVLGQGTGSSIDFQDQRAYLPGDDPRHINWQATARTGHMTMKLFRQEVTPRVDLMLDHSPSMHLTEAKSRRVWELVYFCMESALRLGGALRVHVLGGEGGEQPLANALAHSWAEPARGAFDLAAALGRVPLRQGSLRLLISDLLHPAPPEALLPALASSQGRPILLVPWCEEEADPDWAGNIDFEDCETGGRSRRHVTPEMRARYAQAYQTHFQIWHQQAARHHAPFARVCAAGDFLEAMQKEALPAGAVEV